jgi:hypothetical protein
MEFVGASVDVCEERGVDNGVKIVGGKNISSDGDGNWMGASGFTSQTPQRKYLVVCCGDEVIGQTRFAPYVSALQIYRRDDLVKANGTLYHVLLSVFRVALLYLMDSSLCGLVRRVVSSNNENTVQKMEDNIFVSDMSL